VARRPRLFTITTTRGFASRLILHLRRTHGTEPLAVASGYLLGTNPVATATGSVPDLFT
jgi:hypothetical protein